MAPRRPAAEKLRQRYEEMRERALARAAIGTGSGILVRQGMRSWMETGCSETAAATLAPAAGRLRPDQVFPQIVAVLAGLLVWQAERNYSGQRKA